MIPLSFNKAKLQAGSLTPKGLERPLQTPGTGFHFAVFKSLLLCASVSLQIQKNCVFQTVGYRAPIRLTCQFVAHTFTCNTLLCAKQMRDVCGFSYLYWDLSQGKVLCVCVYEGEN